MAATRLSIEQKKFILKTFWTFENVAEMQRQIRREFQSDLPTQFIIAKIRNMFKALRTVQNVHKQYSGRLWSSINHTTEERLVDQCLQFYCFTLSAIIWSEC